jgi:hypothetical protein
MIHITKEIERKFEASPLYAHDGKDAKDVPVIAKYFNAYGAGTWYITEAEKIDEENGGGWVFFGLCKIHEAEFGYVYSGEMFKVRGIERDMYWSGTLADAKKAEGLK